MGRRRMRYRESSTMIRAPLSSSAWRSLNTSIRRGLTDIGVSLRNRKIMTLGDFCTPRASKSAKSRSKVSMTRPLSIPRFRISRSGRRYNPCSGKCRTSCPESRSV